MNLCIFSVIRADKVNRGIETISTDGKSTSVVTRHQEGPPTDVIKHGNQIYWTDMFAADLKFISLGGNFVRSIKIGSFENVSSVVIQNNRTNFFPKMAVINKDMSYLNELFQNHECSYKNPKRKVCSHACLMNGQGLNGICVCPMGEKLDVDGLTCLRPSTCSQNQFTCQDGHCINSEYICDGVLDCTNGDDEVNCKNSKCERDDFKCEANGYCIPCENYK